MGRYAIACLALVTVFACGGEEIVVTKLEPRRVKAVVAPVEPQEPEPAPRMVVIPKESRRRYTAVLLARVAVNENTRILRAEDDGGTNGEPTPDARALIQEEMAFAKWKGVGLRKAIKWQSPRVTGEKEPQPGSQHAWTSTLPARGKAMPSGWVECTGQDSKTGNPVPKGCDGRWEVYADNWEKFRGWMIRTIVHEGEIEAECDGDPITWGCEGDDHIAIRRGLCVVEGCGDRNVWWAFPGHGCDEPLKDVIARELGKRADPQSVSVKEMMRDMRAMRERDG